MDSSPRSPNQELQVRWFDRWLTAAIEDIWRRKTEIARIRQEMTAVANDDLRDCLAMVIDQNEGIIENIRISHRHLQEIANGRLNLDIPDLA